MNQRSTYKTETKRSWSENMTMRKESRSRTKPQQKAQPMAAAQDRQKGREARGHIIQDPGPSQGQATAVDPATEHFYSQDRTSQR